MDFRAADRPSASAQTATRLSRRRRVSGARGASRALGLVALLTFAAPARASVKGLAPPPAQPVVLTDGESVSPLQIESVTVKRGFVRGCNLTGSSDDLGMISITFKMPGRGAHAACDFAFALELAAGALPTGLAPVDGLYSAWCHDAYPDGPFAFFIPWSDERRNDQDAFAFALRISAVDGAGRRGSPSLVTIAHDGTPLTRQPCAEATPAVSGGDAGASDAAARPGDRAAACAFGGETRPGAAVIVGFALLGLALQQGRRRGRSRDR
jgi:hypothetical protein